MRMTRNPSLGASVLLCLVKRSNSLLVEQGKQKYAVHDITLEVSWISALDGRNCILSSNYSSAGTMSSDTL